MAAICQWPIAKLGVGRLLLLAINTARNEDLCPTGLGAGKIPWCFFVFVITLLIGSEELSAICLSCNIAMPGNLFWAMTGSAWFTSLMLLHSGVLCNLPWLWAIDVCGKFHGMRCYDLAGLLRHLMFRICEIMT